MLSNKLTGVKIASRVHLIDILWPCFLVNWRDWFRLLDGQSAQSLHDKVIWDLKQMGQFFRWRVILCRAVNCVPRGHWVNWVTHWSGHCRWWRWYDEWRYNRGFSDHSTGERLTRKASLLIKVSVLFILVLGKETGIADTLERLVDIVLVALWDATVSYRWQWGWWDVRWHLIVFAGCIQL